MKTWKRILSVGITLAVLLGLLIIPAPVRAAGETVTIDAPASVGAGVDFRVRITTNTLTNFDACNYDVSYDATKIEIIGTEGGTSGVTAGLISTTTVPVDMWGYIPAGTQGKVRVIQNVSGTSGVTGSGYLADLHFRVKSGVTSGTVSLAFSAGCLSDNASNAISATWVNDSLTINSGLTAQFNVSRSDATAGVTSITFTDTATGGTPPYTSYAWDFNNDGTTDSTLQNPSYTFPSAGTYNVKLTVTDSLPGGQAGQNTATSSLTTITVYSVVTANFSASASPTVGVSGRTVFTFTDQTTGGKQGLASSEYTWNWDFGDSTTSTLKNPTKTYAVGAEGSKTVSLTATDTFSGTPNSDSETKTGYITVYCAGDANRTGGALSTSVVNSADVTYLEHQIMGHTGYPVESTVANDAGDANGDGSLSAQDITKTELIMLSAP